MVQSLFEGVLLRKAGPFSDEALYHLGSEAARLSEELLYYYGQEVDPSVSQARYQALPIHSLKDLAINGRDLLSHFDQSSGPWMKEVLAAAEKAVIEKRVANEEKALLAFAKTIVLNNL